MFENLDIPVAAPKSRWSFSQLTYDPEKGEFHWPGGKLAGCVNTLGYRVIRVEGTLHYAHRLAIRKLTGDWPKGEVDHINMVRDDNRAANLRDVSSTVNKQNIKSARVTSKTGLLGVMRSSAHAWTAQIIVNGRRICLGVHSTPELAHAKYMEAKRQHHV